MSVEEQLAPLPVDPAVLASKRVVFVGALPDEATVTMVRAAMIPFGDIKSVDMVRSVLSKFTDGKILGTVSKLSHFWFLGYYVLS